MNFLKMHGCGNDFIVTHEIAQGYVEQLSRRAPLLCDRRKGIGADGIILILPASGSDADCAMCILNADGSEAEMCGNGIRCLARYMKEKGLTSGERLAVQTGAGLIQTEIIRDMVRVNMGNPVLEAPLIPVALSCGRVILHPLVVDDRSFAVTAVSMGNPHAVIFADELDDELVLGYGPKIESHPFFPRRVNVEFARVVSDAEVTMRVFERGVGETAACGTGACAVAVAGILNHRLSNTATVHLTGGDLRIEWDGNGAHPLYMTGPAVSVFEGVVSDA